MRLLSCKVDGLMGHSFFDFRLANGLRVSVIYEFVAEDDLELKGGFVAVITEEKGSIPDIERFSKFQKLVRTSAWIRRFIKNCRAKILKLPTPVQGELLPEELEQAEMNLAKFVQMESFPEEMKLLSSKQELTRSNRIFGLTPQLDDYGVLRIRGRTALAPDIDNFAKNPAILDSKHPFTKLLLQYYHEKIGHCGQEAMLNELRQKYWVISARSAVKKACFSCQFCKVQKARPQAPMMGNLPEGRVTAYVRPFTYTGIDYFGPLTVTVGRRHEKRYGVLFTCLTTRAVHLEIANSLTSDSTIMAIRRMIGRRGSPKEMFSDNGTNLRGADSELRAALKDLDQQKITQDMAARAIKWHFIPPSAPHMGGSWERLVRSVKTALRTTLKERSPKDEVLSTLFIEAEHIVNCHPLTHVPVDPDDPESLTPNHFLLGSSSGEKSPGAFSDRDICLRSQWKTAQRLADHFWNRWVKEYLPTLTRRTKWHQRSSPVKIGDVVVIADGAGPRNSWPLGLVTATFPGRDGVVRVVDVKTCMGTFRRPVVKLCVLDVKARD